MRKIVIRSLSHNRDKWELIAQKELGKGRKPRDWITSEVLFSLTTTIIVIILYRESISNQYISKMT